MDAQTYINILTPVVAPLVVMFVKKFWAKIPTLLVPVIATAVGAIGNLIATHLAGNPKNIGLAIVLGLAAIGLREVADQTKQTTARMFSDEEGT